MADRTLITIFKGKRGLGGPTDGLGMVVAFAMRDYLHEFRGARWNVFTCIGLHGNDYGIAWPSIATIQRETGYGSETVVKAIKELCDLVIQGDRVLASWRERDNEGKFTGSARYIIFPRPGELRIIAHRGQKGITIEQAIMAYQQSQISVSPNVEKSTCGKTEMEENPSSKENPLFPKGASPQAILEDWRATMNAAIDNGKGVNVSAALARLARELELPPYAGLATVPSSMIARMGKIAKMADPGGRARDGMWDVADKMCYVAELDEPVTNVLDYLTKCYQPESDDWLDAALRSLEAMGDGK